MSTREKEIQRKGHSSIIITSKQVETESEKEHEEEEKRDRILLYMTARGVTG